jgi:hypothetical protein
LTAFRPDLFGQPAETLFFGSAIMTAGRAPDIASRRDRCRHFETAATVIAILCLAVASAAADLRVIKPQAGPLDAGDGFSFADTSTKTRQSASGIACPQNRSGKHICLIVFDEGGEARYATIDGKIFTPDLERVVVLRDEGGELDAEAAATDGRFFYVTGSHSVKRNNCAQDPARQHVIRFAVDPGTGRAARDANGKLTDYSDSSRLPALMALLPELKQHVGRCLGGEEGGANIEGLAIRGERLFFGFRGPAKNKQALILSVDAAAFFQGADAKPEITRLVVGGGRGIRDLHAVKDGILVLAGPDDDEDNQNKSYRIALWDGRKGSRKAVKPKMLAQLGLKKIELRDCDKETKPEALAVLEDSPKRYRIMILSDGMCDGGPLLFAIPRGGKATAASRRVD